jgi:BirA family biotin operon repressor/biotin-[acetyl-CoA-carboxylase] ligase
LPDPAINLSHGNLKPIGHNFIELKSVDSTNNYAMAKVHAGLASPGTVFFAHEQLAGKGQRGRTWTSAPGENITMSIVLKPVFLQPMQQFMLSACVALACHDFLGNYISEELSIKWPNDLYWRDRKAGGILIESVFKGADWLFAIAGIGININQVRFPEGISRAVSLKQITSKAFDVPALAKELCHFLEIRYTELETKGFEGILAGYNRVLFRRNQSVRLKKGNTIFETTIREVSLQGQLQTLDSSGTRNFDFGEVEWVMEEI